MKIYPEGVDGYIRGKSYEERQKMVEGRYWCEGSGANTRGRLKEMMNLVT